MKNLKLFLKKNKNLLIGFIIGLSFASFTVYAANINSKDVAYTNTTSGLTSTNVQGAMDELNAKADNILNQKIIAWTYNQTEGASNYCVTGNESTCNKTECYKKNEVNSCAPGTIIDYPVNKSLRKRFHVLHDDGHTITMQSQSNIIYNTPWYIYALKDTTHKGITIGPSTVLTSLEQATSSWSNVNDLNYEMGTTVFKNNAYTDCSSYNTCTSNSYTWSEKNKKARMITVQEAADSSIGCTDASGSCPKWMCNYLHNSGDETVNSKYADGFGSSETLYNGGYWTMSTNSAKTSPWAITSQCTFGGYYELHPSASVTKEWMIGARAVVEINKPNF